MGYVILLAQSDCIASEKEDETTKLLRTHNMEVVQESGDRVFYPKEYGSYQKFKEEYVEKEYITELLSNRLKVLHNYMGTYDKDSKESEHDYYKNLLSRNQIAITSNCTQETLNSIKFITDYTYPSLTYHMIHIASILKERLGDRSPRTLNNLISDLKNKELTIRQYMSQESGETEKQLFNSHMEIKTYG